MLVTHELLFRVGLSQLVLLFGHKNDNVLKKKLVWVFGCSGDDSVDCSISLPIRVYVPWNRGVLVCDYLLLHETLEVNPTIIVVILLF